MFKRALRTILMVIGGGVVLLFIWQVWGKTGDLGGFFLMIWNFFYTVCSAIVDAIRQGLGVIN